MSVGSTSLPCDQSVQRHNVQFEPEGSPWLWGRVGSEGRTRHRGHRDSGDDLFPQSTGQVVFVPRPASADYQPAHMSMKPGEIQGGRRGLPSNCDSGTVVHRLPDLLDLPIGHGHAAVCPIDEPVKPSEERCSIREAMNHDEATGIFTLLARTPDVRFVRIRDMEGSVKRAVVLSIIDRVLAFRCSFVDLSLLVTNRICSQGYVVAPKHLSVPHQSQLAG